VPTKPYNPSRDRTVGPMEDQQETAANEAATPKTISFAVSGLLAATLANFGFTGFGIVGLAAGSAIPLNSTVHAFLAAASAAIAAIAGLAVLVRILTTPWASKQLP
jgi:hypothetical protein